jgi:ubiquinone/menaquinone biosynthesis C-methylase UbiE
VSSSTPDVIERERTFYNESHGRYRQIREAIWKAIGPFNRNEEISRTYDARGKRVLLYGCGPANEAAGLLRHGAVSIAGIDISDVEIDVARRQAQEAGVADRCDFRAGDAHATGFPDQSFDLILGLGVLHHLDVPRAMRELRRVLAPGGRAVFVEPLAGNPILRVGRTLTPAARTEDEHPFTAQDWASCAAVFPGFSHREVELTSILLMPVNLILPLRLQRALVDGVSRLDDWLLSRFPRLRPLARTTHLILE